MAIGHQHAKVPPPELVNLTPDAWTEPFWQAARERRLVAQRCTACQTFRMPPAPFCHQCQSQAHEWVTLSGKGRVYSFTVARKALIPQLADAIPYIVAVVELPDAGGVRLITNLVDCDPDLVTVSMPVEVVWDEVKPGTVIPRFRPQYED